MQLQFQNRVGLLGAERILRVGLREASRQVDRDLFAGEVRHQVVARLGPVLAAADDRNHMVQVVQRLLVALQNVRPVLGLLQQERRAPADHIDAVVDEVLQRLHQSHLARLAVHHGQEDHAEAFLHLGVLVELVQHNLRLRAALQLHHDPHSVAVALVADVADLFNRLFVHQLGDAFDQPRLVHLVGNLGDDDRLALLGQVLALHLGPHQEAAASRAVRLVQSLASVDKPGGGEVRPLHDGQNLFQLRLRFFHQQNRRRHNLGQVVRRNVGGHAHGDAVRAVDQQRRNARRQHRRLHRRVVEVGDEVHRVLVDVGQQLGRNRGQPRFRVSVGRRRIAVHRTEVALSVHQRVAQRKILRHAHRRVIHRAVAVRVIFAQHLAHHLGALHVLAVVQQPHVVHRIQNPPVHRLQPVADVGQRAPDDDRHRVVEIGALHLFFNVDRLYVLGWTTPAFQRELRIVGFVGHRVLTTFRHL